MTQEMGSAILDRTARWITIESSNVRNTDGMKWPRGRRISSQKQQKEEGRAETRTDMMKPPF
jgi:hypothetical protein